MEGGRGERGKEGGGREGAEGTEKLEYTNTHTHTYMYTPLYSTSIEVISTHGSSQHSLETGVILTGQNGLDQTLVKHTWPYHLLAENDLEVHMEITYDTSLYSTCHLSVDYMDVYLNS